MDERVRALRTRTRSSSSGRGESFPPPLGPAAGSSLGACVRGVRVVRSRSGGAPPPARGRCRQLAGCLHSRPPGPVPFPAPVGPGLLVQVGGANDRQWVRTLVILAMDSPARLGESWRIPARLGGPAWLDKSWRSQKFKIPARLDEFWRSQAEFCESQRGWTNPSVAGRILAEPGDSLRIPAWLGES